MEPISFYFLFSFVTEQVSNGDQKSNRKLTETEIVAQCILFFLAGFETTASTLNYIFFEFSQNIAIQNRLKDELDQALADVDPSDSERVYEVIMNEVPYLDACVKETLRKYPPVSRLERRVGKNGYKLAGVELEKDTLVEISSQAVHHNPDYYPDPEQYNPDRFLPENKDRLVPYTYLPFGLGPRNCVGNRFAYQEIKLFLARVVTKYLITPSVNTPKKLIFKPSSGLLMPACTAVNIEARCL